MTIKLGVNGFYVMCEIPHNVVLADEFGERFDGFSIGANDLTQLTPEWIATPNSSTSAILECERSSA